MQLLPIFDAGRSFDATSLTASYQDVGAVMASPVYGFAIYNTSDVDVQVSFDDGTSDGPIVPAGGVFEYSRLNQVPNSELASFMIPTGTQIQVKQVTGAGADGDLIINIVRVRE